MGEDAARLVTSESVFACILCVVYVVVGICLGNEKLDLCCLCYVSISVILLLELCYSLF